jgi:hypothetical protein
MCGTMPGSKKDNDVSVGNMEEKKKERKKERY